MYSLAELKSKLTHLINAFYVEMGKKQALEKRLADCQARISVLDTGLDATTKGSLFLQTLSDSTRAQVSDKIAAIVTDALQKVKDKNLEFKMLLSTERNQTDLKFFIVDKETKQQYDIMTSCGGGIADLVTFPLRIALLLKWNPELSKVLVMDENFKFVSVADQEMLGEFIRQLSEKLGVQIILVTHSPTLTAKAHRVFEVTKTSKDSQVEVKP